MLNPLHHTKSYNLTMILYQWALILQQEGHPIIMAGIGKPTYPINIDFVESNLAYWKELHEKSLLARKYVSDTAYQEHDPIVDLNAVIDYGEPQGDYICRDMIAKSLSESFKNKITVGPENIIFTVGGSSALYNIFKILNKRKPNGLMVTSFPYYALYAGPEEINNLYPIPVMETSGYRLTADILKTTLKKAEIEAHNQNTSLSAFILCNPNNPLGTVLDENELKEIAEILRSYPDMYIILDEVYAEICFSDIAFVSLLEAAPDLKEKIIMMRSGTKAISAAGERIAIAVSFDKKFMHELVVENVNTTSHASRSTQLAFAHALSKMNLQELNQIRNYYEPQVRYVENRLKSMGIAMPDTEYNVQGGIYVLADLRILLGMEIPESAVYVLNKKGKIENDYEIAFSLLFEHHIMLTPLSTCGISPEKCYFRITCTMGIPKLKELLDRIEIILKSRGN